MGRRGKGKGRVGDGEATEEGGADAGGGRRQQQKKKKKRRRRKRSRVIWEKNGS